MTGPRIEIPDPNAPNPPAPVDLSQQQSIEEIFRNAMSASEQARNNAEQRARQLEDELREARRPREVATPPARITGEEFIQDPMAHLNAAVSAQIAPLLETSRRLQAQAEYNDIKNQYRKQFPAFSQIEGYVDDIMQGSQPTHANMQAAIERAVGRLAVANPQLYAKMTGLIPNDAPPANPTPNPDPTVVGNIPRQVDPQAHLRPSLRAPTVDDKKPPRRPLTEDERRICKEYHLSEDQFFESLGAGSTVSSWKREPKK